MVFPNSLELRASASAAVEKDGAAARRIVAIHSAVPAAISLVLTAMNYYLSLQISDTGGLDGLGTRSMLETLQTMLQIANMAFTIFWTMSYTGIISRWARGESAQNSHLWLGFQHFGPVLRAWMLRFTIYLAVAFLAVQLSSFVFSASPAMDLYTPMFEKMLTDTSYFPTEAEMEEFTMSYLPFFGVALLILFVPVAYRLRLMDFALMEHPTKGAFAALRESLALTRRNCWKLFKLDLGFWWFYLLEGLVACLFYGDWLLELMGVDLGLSPVILLFVACVTGLLGQILLYIWRKNQVYTTYALLYQRLSVKDGE